MQFLSATHYAIIYVNCTKESSNSVSKQGKKTSLEEHMRILMPNTLHSSSVPSVSTIEILDHNYDVNVKDEGKDCEEA